MGRRKIEIQPIDEERNRTVTFVKRKAGLFKKAHELSILCKVDIAVIIIGHNHKVYEYSSDQPEDILDKYHSCKQLHESKRPNDYGSYKLVSRISATKKKGDKRTASVPAHQHHRSISNMNDDDDEDDEDDDEEGEDEEGDDDDDDNGADYENDTTDNNTTFKSEDDLPSRKRRRTELPLKSNHSNQQQIPPSMPPFKQTIHSQGKLPSTSPQSYSGTANANTHTPTTTSTTTSTKTSKRPTLSLKIPKNDKSSSDSAITVTALDSATISDAGNKNNSSLNSDNIDGNNEQVNMRPLSTSNPQQHLAPINTSMNSAGNSNISNNSLSSGSSKERKLMIPSNTPTSSYLPGLNIITQQNQSQMDQANSNKSTPLSATLPHGLFSSLPQMSPSQILPTPIFPQQAHMQHQQQMMFQQQQEQQHQQQENQQHEQQQHHHQQQHQQSNSSNQLPYSQLHNQFDSYPNKYVPKQQGGVNPQLQQQPDSAQPSLQLQQHSALFPMYQMQLNGRETPVLPSGLPSKFVDMFPSPNVFYSQEWPIPIGTGNTPLPTSATHLLPLINNSNNSNNNTNNNNGANVSFGSSSSSIGSKPPSSGNISNTATTSASGLPPSFQMTQSSLQNTNNQSNSSTSNISPAISSATATAAGTGSSSNQPSGSGTDAIPGAQSEETTLAGGRNGVSPLQAIGSAIYNQAAAVQQQHNRPKR